MLSWLDLNSIPVRYDSPTHPALFAGLLGGLAGAPALADHHMVSGCNDCRSGHRLFGHRRDCGPCEEKVCVSKAAKVKTTKTIYDCKCEDFCLPATRAAA